MADLITLGFAFIAAGAGVTAVWSVGNTEKRIASALRKEAYRWRLDSESRAAVLSHNCKEVGNFVQAVVERNMEAAVEAIRTPVLNSCTGISDELKSFGDDNLGHRDLLRSAVEKRLDTAEQRISSSTRDLRDSLSNSLEQTSSLLVSNIKVLSDHQKERLDRLLSALEILSQHHLQSQDALRVSVETRLDAIRAESSQKLEEMRRNVDERLEIGLEKRIGESFRTVTEQLERVHSGLGDMQALASGVGDLKRLFSHVKSRGGLGEVQLGMLLEQFLSPAQYCANAIIREGADRGVEYAIRLPGRDTSAEVLLPIDAKFPQDIYMRLVEASERGDVDAISQATAALEASVISCAKFIHDQYICPPLTTEYAILFLPTEGIFAEVLRRPGLLEQIQKEWHVTIAGPTTLTSLLSAFQMGFQSHALQRRSSEVWKLLAAVRTEFSRHGDTVDKLKKQLNSASNVIDQLGFRTNVMSRRLHEVEMLPQSEIPGLFGLGINGEMPHEEPLTN
ncbi:DNA recombination protein RmuC [Rhizomicrobium palustre]|uniref:DNA recombination protein RmuC homolog n=1 Tax=Rhizomicrobium palustre TaxID=189966 RepID=A0A846N3V5_9PROT|nr:DNA recombination protein RmuC [Rhizomicrobium palustre]NIK89750.1 DNA recombination protein RmuC [Rhizomicrobium palustre]